MSTRRRISRIAFATGVNPNQLARFLRGLPFFFADRLKFRQMWKNSNSRSSFAFKYSTPMSGDRFEHAGSVRGHYFIQDLHVAQRIFQRNPVRHIDVGSRIDGFVSHVASFRTLDVIDVRRLETPHPNIQFHQGDLTNLDPTWFESTDSLSCLHALEHIGLGRYGDSLDPDGWERGLESLAKMLKTDGILYLSVPTGVTQRVEFNSQRVFQISALINRLRADFIVERLCLISESGLLTEIENQDLLFESQIKISENYCSVWELRRHG